jgi:multiple sugar transport system permease protein
VLNSIVLHIPAVGFIAIGALFLAILTAFARRLLLHRSHWGALLCFAAGVVMFVFMFRFAWPILTREGVPWYKALIHTSQQEYRWLEDSRTAMLCCVMPMVWAGMGPGCLIYLAALKGVSGDLYEAADIDGATFVDKVLFVVIPILKPLLIIQFVGVFINSWRSSAYILAMTGGASDTTVAGLHIFYEAYLFLKFGPATAMAWILGFMLIGFTVHQLRILSRLEFRTTGK